MKARDKPEPVVTVTTPAAETEGKPTATVATQAAETNAAQQARQAEEINGRGTREQQIDKLKDRLAEGGKPVLSVHNDGSVSVGASSLDSVELYLTPEEKKALKRAIQDGELADSAAERSEAIAAQRAAVQPAVDRLIGGDAPAPTSSLKERAEAMKPSPETIELMKQESVLRSILECIG